MTPAIRARTDMTHPESPDSNIPFTGRLPKSEFPQARDNTVIGEHPPERLAQINRLRLINVALLIALIVLGLAWELWLAPLKGGTGYLALKVLPLTLAVAGTIKNRLYTYRWMSLLIWLYFTEGVVRASNDSGTSQALACLEVALSTALFTAGTLYVRLRLRILPPKEKTK